MSGREVREYTNLTDPKDKKWGKGKEKIDDEDITFQRMVAKMQEVAGERGGYLHGRGALDSDDLLYLKEQMEAEEDAERLLRRTEKRAFAAFKGISIPNCLHSCASASDTQYIFSLTNGHKAASLADSSPAAVPLPLRVEPKPKSGIRQHDLLKNIVEIRPKRYRVSSPSDGNQPAAVLSPPAVTNEKAESNTKKELTSPWPNEGEAEFKSENPIKSLLGLAYESSESEED